MGTRGPKTPKKSYKTSRVSFFHDSVFYDIVKEVLSM